MDDYTTPTYDLEAVKQAVKFNAFRTTTTCRTTAAQLGLSTRDMKDIFLELEANHFYKTTSSNNGDGTFQDVYHYPWNELTLYIKFKFIDDVLALSFKERD